MVPRRGDTATGAGLLAGAEGDGDAGAEYAATGAGFAAKISSLRIRPPTPVPCTRDRSTPLSAASLRTIGVT